MYYELKFPKWSCYLGLFEPCPKSHMLCFILTVIIIFFLFLEVMGGVLTWILGWRWCVWMSSVIPSLTEPYGVLVHIYLWAVNCLQMTGSWSYQHFFPELPCWDFDNLLHSSSSSRKKMAICFTVGMLLFLLFSYLWSFVSTAGRYGVTCEISEIWPCIMVIANHRTRWVCKVGSWRWI